MGDNANVAICRYVPSKFDRFAHENFYRLRYRRRRRPLCTRYCNGMRKYNGKGVGRSRSFLSEDDFINGRDSATPQNRASI